jgi:hypothetical protein
MNTRSEAHGNCHPMSRGYSAWNGRNLRNKESLFLIAASTINAYIYLLSYKGKGKVFPSTGLGGP